MFQSGGIPGLNHTVNYALVWVNQLFFLQSRLGSCFHFQEEMRNLPTSPWARQLLHSSPQPKTGYREKIPCEGTQSAVVFCAWGGSKGESSILPPWRHSHCFVLQGMGGDWNPAPASDSLEEGVQIFLNLQKDTICLQNSIIRGVTFSFLHKDPI